MSEAEDFFNQGLDPGLLTSVNCSGTESEILECSHEASSQGLHCGAAGVVCQGLLAAKCIHVSCACAVPATLFCRSMSLLECCIVYSKS